MPWFDAINSTDSYIYCITTYTLSYPFCPYAAGRYKIPAWRDLLWRIRYVKLPLAIKAAPSQNRTVI